MPRSRTVAVEVYESVGRLAPEWDELADRAGASPFLRPGWIGAWWRAFGEGEPEILAVRDDGRLAAVLPLYRSRGVLRTMTNEHGIESGLLGEPASLPELSRALIDRLDHRASLLFVDPARPGLAELRAAVAASGSRVIVRKSARPPYVPVDGDWAGYEHRLGTKLLADLRRRRRRLEERGQVSLELTDGRERLDKLLDDGFAVEASGWKGTGGTAIASQPATARFYRDIARWAVERGWLRLAFLRVDGRAIAFELGLCNGATHYRVKVGFDPAHRDVAPGKQLLHAVLAATFAAGKSRFDFLGTDDAYKLEWATGLRDLVLVQVFAGDLGGSAAWAALRVGIPLARRARAILGRG